MPVLNESSIIGQTKSLDYETGIGFNLLLKITVK